VTQITRAARNRTLAAAFAIRQSSVGDWGAMDQKHEEGDWFVLYQKPTRSCIHYQNIIICWILLITFDYSSYSKNS
jgi:hypothetical protein